MKAIVESSDVGTGNAHSSLLRLTPTGEEGTGGGGGRVDCGLGLEKAQVRCARVSEADAKDCAVKPVANLQNATNAHARVPTQHALHKGQQGRPAAVPCLDALAGDNAPVVEAAGAMLIAVRQCSIRDTCYRVC